jgi:hypothetical protein
MAKLKIDSKAIDSIQLRTYEAITGVALDNQVPFIIVGASAAYSRPRLPLIPDEACHPFHAKAATDSTAKLPPRQVA